MKLFFFLFLSASLSCFAEKVRVACIGDSITFGSGIKERKMMSYPSQLAKLLGDEYHVRNFGVSGATMLKKGNRPYWKTKAFKPAQDFQPDIVIIKLGTNDSKAHNWEFSSHFADDYTDFIKVFSSLKSKPKIYICRPIPAFFENFKITNEIIAGGVIPEINKVAESHDDVILIDLYTVMSGKAEMVPDGIHPNAKGAGVIAEAVAAELLKEEVTAE